MEVIIIVRTLRCLGEQHHRRTTSALSCLTYVLRTELVSKLSARKSDVEGVKYAGTTAATKRPSPDSESQTFEAVGHESRRLY
jgi:hypothetical protein